MKMLQFSSVMQLLGITEARKSSKFTTILVVFLISLPLLVMVKNSKFRIIESSGNPSSSSVENAQNNTANFSEGLTQNITASTGGSKNSSPNPPTTSNLPPADHKILLDELFASGFDKESCLSRYQSSSYRKSRPYKPSPYLISRLRSYEQLHARCGPKSVLYTQTLRKLSESNNVKETTSCQYLVWTPANGLGNRMLSVASAFLFAFVKNRVLLVEFNNDMNDLFCDPFPNSTWLLPHTFPYQNNWNSLPTFKSMINSSGDHTGFNPSFLHLQLQHGDGDANLRHFNCNDTQSFLEKIPALIVRSDQYFVPSLFMIPSLKEELNRMFPETVAVFHHLGHYLFNPSNEVWGLITRYYQAYLSKADEKIGIQIRLYSPKQRKSKTVMTQIKSCLLKNNILPSVDTNKPLSSESGNRTSNSKAVLVASLYPEYAEELRAIYWTRPTVTGDVISVFQPSHEEKQKFWDSMHNMKALAEIYLLSLCDVLVTSHQSTFGYVAHSLGGVKPWILDSLGMKRGLDQPCMRDISMEPCFHFPPEYDCKGKNKIDNFTTLYPNLMPCEDVRWGVKLVAAQLPNS